MNDESQLSTFNQQAAVYLDVAQFPITIERDAAIRGYHIGYRAGHALGYNGGWKHGYDEGASAAGWKAKAKSLLGPVVIVSAMIGWVAAWYISH